MECREQEWQSGKISDPTSTVVHFAHASIGEFFHQERETKTAAIGFDENKAHLAILSTCLEIFCDDETFNNCKDNSLAQYASANWPLHLASIDLAGLSRDEKREVGALLLTVMHDEATLLRWCEPSVEVKAVWVDTEVYADVVMRWLQDENIVASADEGQHKWLVSLTSFLDIIRHIVHVVALQWLQNSVHSPWNSFFTVFVFATAVCSPSQLLVGANTLCL